MNFHKNVQEYEYRQQREIKKNEINKKSSKTKNEIIKASIRIRRRGYQRRNEKKVTQETIDCIYNILPRKETKFRIEISRYRMAYILGLNLSDLTKLIAKEWK